MKDVEDIVLTAQGGSVEAFARLVRRFQDMAIGYAFSILGDFGLAEDAVQEAFIHAYRDLSDLRKPEAFPAWLRKIVFTHCGRLVRGKRISTVHLVETDGFISNADSPMKSAQRGEAREAVQEAIRRLPPNQRAVTMLFYIDGYSLAEVGQFLGVSVPVVKNRLVSARAKLQERMMGMVDQTLKTSKPGDTFVEKVTRAIDFQKQGRLSESVAAHQQALDTILALQKEGRHAAAVRLHRKAMKALSEAGLSPQTWADTYRELAPSYYAIGKALELAEGHAAALPTKPTAEIAFKAVLHQLGVAEAFRKAGKPERAAETYQNALKALKGAAARAAFRFWRSEVLTRMWSMASEQGDGKEADLRLEQIQANLQEMDKKLAALRRSGKTNTKTICEVDDRDGEDWFKWAALAYHQVAVVVHFKSGNKKEALRLFRQAAGFCPFAPTLVLLARLVLSVEGKREEARKYLATAIQDPRFRNVVRESFQEAEEFNSVREDPEFLALFAPKDRE